MSFTPVKDLAIGDHVLVTLPNNVSFHGAVTQKGFSWNDRIRNYSFTITILGENCPQRTKYMDGTTRYKEPEQGIVLCATTKSLLKIQ